MGRALHAIQRTARRYGYPPDHPLIRALMELDNDGNGSSGAPFLRIIPTEVAPGVPFDATTDPETENVFVLSGQAAMAVNTPTTPHNGDSFTVKGDGANAVTITGTNGHTIDGSATYAMPAAPAGPGATYQQGVTLAFDADAGMWRAVWFYLSRFGGQ